jgi:nucleoside-diphosphate-sugar epimerase
LTAPRVLFIGGSGLISSACAKELVHRGVDLYVMVRGQTTRRALPPEAHVVHADARDSESVDLALKDRNFDVVVNFIGFTPAHVAPDIERFKGRVSQYIFISTTSVYQRPVAQLPIVESTPRTNVAWPYPKDKIDCELMLEKAHRECGFPATVVRPAHTYDCMALPPHGKWTVVDRMRRGKPVVVHGDGTSLWTLTHSRDFARGFAGLVGNPHAIGDSAHITTDEILTWDQIYEAIATAVGVEPKLVHRSSEDIAREIPAWGPSLVSDFAHSLIFDNTKVKRFTPGFVATIPFSVGAREIIDWYDADPSRGLVDPAIDAAMDHLVVTH